MVLTFTYYLNCLVLEEITIFTFDTIVSQVINIITSYTNEPSEDGDFFYDNLTPFTLISYILLKLRFENSSGLVIHLILWKCDTFQIYLVTLLSFDIKDGK